MKRTREDQPASGYPSAGAGPAGSPAGGAPTANTPSPTAARAPQQQPVRATATVAPPTAGMPKVQDALGYLDKVKVRTTTQPTHHTAHITHGTGTSHQPLSCHPNQPHPLWPLFSPCLSTHQSTYSHNPQVYNHFLDIMKDFKSMAIDTEGVIKRVKSLFVGHRALIQGFNQFLPPGYKIDADSVAGVTPATATPAATAAKPITPASAAATPATATATATPAKPAASAAAPAGSATAAGGPQQANAALANKPTVEFNHAVNYVAKIKHRFRDQPAIYSEFLDILHDYQAKRTIEEVYHRVQKLFGNEPDLLAEFRYFLPENPAAANKPAASGGAGGGGGSARKPGSGGTSGSKSSGGSAVKKSGGSTAPSTIASATKPGEESKASRLVSSAQQRVQGKQQASSSKLQPKKGDKQPPSSSSSKSAKDKSSTSTAVAGPIAAAVIKPALTYPPGSEGELGMMDRLHHALSRSQWSQFLKCLNLFASDIVSRLEMVRMIEDLLLPPHQHHDAHTVELFERFKQAIQYNEWDEKALITAQHSNYYTFVASVDFTTCPQVTPSYRQLPAAVSTLYCSGRTALCEQVLNDKCISIPTGSEDFSFKATRKNIYEENLFKVEDERFELDMIIENNAAVIRVLEPLVESVQNMSSEQAKHVTLNENLDILHLRSISRIYGENGYEMIELLKTCPALTAKVILERLHQKDEEWRRVRSEMKNVWRKISEQNYQRSLDHRSFYFKQEDKKRRAPKALVTELREVHNRVFELSAGMEEGEDDIFAGLRPGIEESVMLRQIRQGHVIKPLYTYSMHWTYEDDSIHRRMKELLVRVARDVFRYTEREVMRLEEFFVGFVWLFFGVEVREDEWREVDRLEREVREREEKGEVEAAGGDGGVAEMEVVEEEDAEDGGGEEGRGLSGKVRKRNNQTVDGMEVESDAGSVAVGAKAVAGGKGRKKGKGKQVRNRGRQGQQRPKDEMKAEEEEEEEKEDEVEVDVEGGSGRLERSSSAAASVAAATGGGDKKHSKEEEKDSADDDDQSSKPRMSPTPASTTSTAHSISTLARDILAAHLNLPPPNPIKPITLAPATFHLDNSLHPARTHARPSHLFYGSHAYYVFFRLHQFLYDRLHTAKSLAFKPRRVSQKKKLPATGEERWARFNVLLDEFVRGEGEGKGESRFEDECRNLLGASSYVLFTMDKVIHQCLKQVVALLNSDVSMQLLQLYAQETRRAKQERDRVSARGGGEKELEELSGRLCRQYQYQCQLILNNDNLTQLEYFADTRELGIGLCEGLAISDGSTNSGSSHDATLGGKVAAWHGESDKQGQDGREWRDYMEHFVYDTINDDDLKDVDPADRKYLYRNVSFVKKHRRTGRAGIRTNNGLELKVCMKTYRLIFVEGTADVQLHWPRPPTQVDEDRMRTYELDRRWMGEFDTMHFNDLVPDYVPPAVQADEADDEVMAVSEAAGESTGEPGDAGENAGGDGEDEEGGVDGDGASETVSVSASPSPAPGGAGQGGALFSAVAAAQQSAEANAGSPSPTPTPTSPADEANGA